MLVQLYQTTFTTFQQLEQQNIISHARKAFSQTKTTKKNKVNNFCFFCQVLLFLFDSLSRLIAFLLYLFDF